MMMVSVLDCLFGLGFAGGKSTFAAGQCAAGRVNTRLRMAASVAASRGPLRSIPGRALYTVDCPRHQIPFR